MKNELIANLIFIVISIKVTIMCVSFLTFFKNKKFSKFQRKTEFWKTQNPMFWSKGRRHGEGGGGPIVLAILLI